MEPSVSSPAAAPATTSAIPFKRDSDVGAHSLAGGGIGILLLSLCAIAIVWYARKRLNLAGAQQNSSKKRIRILESQRLGPRAVLTVVEYSGRELLLAQTEHGVSVLCDAQKEQG